MQGQIRTYLRTTLIYVIFGIVWIFTTDQILIIEAESCGGFDENVIRIAKDVSRKAKLELMKLEELESVTPETIHDTVYRRSEK